MISIGEIIYRIQENPLLRAVKTSDIVNHIKTVIQLVGVPGMKEDVYIHLLIIDYRAQLPEDFLERVSVRYINGNERIVLTHGTDQYAQFNKDVFNSTIVADNVYSHRIINGYIYTDFQEGDIELVYKRYHKDANGWPMIPNNQSLVLAIENYIKSRYFRILADNNASFERAYQEAEKQYCWYVAQATSSLLTLDPVEAQALGSELVRLLPMKDNFYSSEKYSGQPERMNRIIW